MSYPQLPPPMPALEYYGSRGSYGKASKPRANSSARSRGPNIIYVKHERPPVRQRVKFHLPEAHSSYTKTDVSKKRKRKRARSVRQELKKFKKSVYRKIADRTNYTVMKTQASGKMDSSINSCDHEQRQISGVTNFETVLGNLRIVRVTDAGATETAPLDVRAANIPSLGVNIRTKHRYHMKNNQATPAHVWMYYIEPREDGDTSPVDAFSQGLGQMQLGATPTTDPKWWLTDSDLFNQMWVIKNRKSYFMQPGDEVFWDCDTGWKKYSADKNDQDPRAYLKKVTGFVVTRVQGTVAHDSTLTTTQFGLCSAQIDFLRYEKYEVKMNSPVKVKFVDDLGGTFNIPTNGFVCTNVAIEIEQDA